MSTFPLLETAFLAASVVLAADRVPTFDVEEFCRDIAITVAPFGNRQVCLRQEREARQALVKQWAKFPAEDRSFCVKLATIGDHPGTYIELLTCLELQRAASQLPDSDEETTGHR